MHILITFLVTVTIAEMMFGMGLRLSFSGLYHSVSEFKSMVYRAVILNYLIVPGITLLILVIFHVPPWVAVGILILAVCPAAPYGPPFTAIAKGNLAIATGLMIILAGSSAIIAPLLLHLLLPIISGGDLTITINSLKLIGTLFFIQLLPLCIGLTIGQWRPGLASRLVRPASNVSKVLNLLMITAIAILQFKVFYGFDPKVIGIMMLLVTIALVTGWASGWPVKENQISVSIITAMRNMSLSMGIAATSFPGTPVITTVLAYSFIAGLGVLVYAFIMRTVQS